MPPENFPESHPCLLHFLMAAIEPAGLGGECDGCLGGRRFQHNRRTRHRDGEGPYRNLSRRTHEE